ncbi:MULTISPECIES: HEPN domain-containing protein [Rhizobium/Agrobacterium group]|uniref:HEPN domain-containing protein n=2 Tax=Neorhizobium TaxID=1525371 RepID=A0ABV0MBX0_9HYPH|nr:MULTISPECIES: HEPN domain-containing protein [Rhizobium/Agrobacterium group]KGD91930.1 hypothetical protein JL39_22335 [Rhizobium sp. YS-1r]MCC2611594.1 HEPN domain-containing protein [Neorhizobium petrolearium]WGI66777.1 HEPN domain-containing protein [Neorhizobium petrolearium]
MAKNLSHPPKKKKTNKPRKEPVTPIGEEVRKHKARLEFSKSIIHLKEAQRLAAWEQAPNACVHSAYYAMYHCATAVILASGGVGKKLDAPESHTHVIEHFGKIIRNQQKDLEHLGMTLNRARTDRMISDYGLVEGVDNELAASTTEDATTFVQTCREVWALEPSSSLLGELEGP